MELDPIILSRIQFAFTVTFHIIFPSLTIGLAAFLVVLEGLWLKTRDETYLGLSKFWTKIFAVSFGMGVVSGIVLSFQFGTNWSGFSNAAGNIVGPLIMYETTTAFFLEATFLGIMLFGRNRVPHGVHFFAACMVALGTLGSAFWILAANSWMQTPVGFEVRDGIFYPVDWIKIIFNPSFPYRFAHMVLAAYITAGFFVAGTGAYYLLKRRSEPQARIMMSLGLGLATILVPAQLVVGHLSGVAMGKNQPAKMAAVEARWETEQPANLVILGWPDEKAEKNLFAIVIPKIGGLIDTGDYNAKMPGLKTWPRKDRPPVAIPFFAFRIMVGMGMIMLLVVVLSLVLRPGGRIYENRLFLRLTAWSLPTGFIAVVAGWFTAEVGRQPWVVYNHLRTADAVAPVSTSEVLASLTLIAVVYLVVFGSGIYYLTRLIRQGPEAPHDDSMPAVKTPKRPLSIPAPDLDVVGKE